MKKGKGLFLALSALFISACGWNKGPIIPDKGNDDSEEEVVIDYTKYVRGEYTNRIDIKNSDGTSFPNGAADPSIVRAENGKYYIFSTGRQMLESDDACNWKVATNSIITQPTWGKEVYPDMTNPYQFGVWAPDVIKIGGRWVFYYALSGWGKPAGIGYGISDNIEGPYTDCGKLFTWKEVGIKNAIDPQVIIDDDGKVWMVLGSFQGIYLVRLAEDGLSLYGGAEEQNEKKILIAGYPGDWDGSTYEGSYIKKKGNKYYYFGSAGTCCEGGSSTYRVYCAVADKITGPYIDKDGAPLTLSGKGKTCGVPVVWSGSGDEKELAGPGHNSILVDEAGEWWIYYHCYTKEDNYAARHLFMDKLIWDEDGFPHVENYRPSYKVTKPGPCIALKEEEAPENE